MKTRSELKLAALTKCRSNWTPLVLATLVYFAICGVAGATTVAAGLVAIFAVSPLEVGLLNSLLAFDRDQSNTDIIESMFRKGFSNNYLHIVLGIFLMDLFVFLWTLLLIIPGIIKSLAYALTPFILAENPEIPAYDAIKLSEKMMMGHKWDLFILILSFIGWFILACLTFGIGFLWLTPYVQMSFCEFYEDIKAEQAGKPLEGTIER